MKDRYLTAEDVMEIVGCSRGRAYELIRLLGYPPPPAGVWRSRLESWLREHGQMREQEAAVAR